MDNRWYLILEGGIKLNLQEEMYIPERVESSDIYNWTLYEVTKILNYNNNKIYEPDIMYEEWLNVFFYVLATFNIVNDTKKIRKLFTDFTKMIENNVCYTNKIPKIMPDDKYDTFLKTRVINVKNYLIGKSEIGVSKNFLLTIKNRYIYLDKIYNILEKNKVKKAKTLDFNMKYFKKLLSKIDNLNNYQKGLAFENVAAYFIKCIPDFRITKRRSKTDLEEIDLTVANISLSYEMWNLGALILIECKNRKEKVGISTIKSLTQTMKIKGSNTTLLFVKNNISSKAKKEIYNQALHDRYIITFTHKDLLKLNDKYLPLDLLKDKYNELLLETQDDLDMIY